MSQTTIQSAQENKPAMAILDGFADTFKPGSSIEGKIILNLAAEFFDLICSLFAKRFKSQQHVLRDFFWRPKMNRDHTDDLIAA